MAETIELSVPTCEEAVNFKVPSGLSSAWDSLPPLQMAIFSLHLQMTFPMCAHQRERESTLESLTAADIDLWDTGLSFVVHFILTIYLKTHSLNTVILGSSI